MKYVKVYKNECFEITENIENVEELKIGTSNNINEITRENEKTVPAEMKNFTRQGSASQCLVSSKVLKGEKVGYLLRDISESPDTDTGWRIFAVSDDLDKMANDPFQDFESADVSIIFNDNPEIIPLLGAKEYSAFQRDENGNFVEVPCDERFTI